MLCSYNVPYTLCLKNATDGGRYSFDIRQPVLITFDKRVPEVVNYP